MNKFLTILYRLLILSASIIAAPIIAALELSKPYRK